MAPRPPDSSPTVSSNHPNFRRRRTATCTCRHGTSPCSPSTTSKGASSSPLPPRCLDSGGFNRPAFIHSFLEKLKRSLSSTLAHFYPLAGRLATLKRTDPLSYTISVDCANSPGARFIHAALDMTVADLLSAKYVPAVVRSFFDHDRVVNHDGHACPCCPRRSPSSPMVSSSGSQ
ncbi:hypothetical protein NL676_024914 [Syzygium grande]|nr:hypothetical protein NL676_024914 [Syzygium grande]